MSMHSMDSPSHRSLDHDSDHDNSRYDDGRAWPAVLDGRARSPAELLDNLRLRLSELPGNHPSAARAADGQEDLDRAVPWSRAVPSDRPEPNGRAERSGRVEPPDDERPDDDIAGGESSAIGHRGNSEAPLADAFGAFWNAGDVTMMQLVDRVGPAEAYLPWFMSGEAAAPWWAAGPDLRAE